MGGKRGRDRRRRKRRPGTIRGTAGEPLARECLENGGTLQEASRVIADNAGYFPSSSAMSRYWQSVRAEAEQVRQLGLWAAALVRDENAYPGCDLTVLARKLFMFRALEAVRKLPEDAFEEVSADRLSLILSRLERSAAQTDHNRVESTDYYLLARDRMMAEWTEILYGKPELQAKLREAVDEDRTKKAREHNPEVPAPGAPEGGGPPAPSASLPAPGDGAEGGLS